MQSSKDQKFEHIILPPSQTKSPSLTFIIFFIYEYTNVFILALINFLNLHEINFTNQVPLFIIFFIYEYTSFSHVCYRQIFLPIVWLVML